MGRVRRTLFALMVPAAALAHEAGASGADATVDSLGALRAEIGSHVVRVRSSGDAFLLKHAVLTSEGVGFGSDDIEAISHWSAGVERVPSLPTSPIAWQAIDRIEVRESGIVKGALLGAVILGLTTFVATRHEASFEASYNLIPIAAIPTGAVIGGVVGAFRPSWRRVWTRTPVYRSDGRLRHNLGTSLPAKEPHR